MIHEPFTSTRVVLTLNTHTPALDVARILSDAHSSPSYTLRAIGETSYVETATITERTVIRLTAKPLVT